MKCFQQTETVGEIVSFVKRNNLVESVLAKSAKDGRIHVLTKKGEIVLELLEGARETQRRNK